MQTNPAQRYVLIPDRRAITARDVANDSTMRASSTTPLHSTETTMQRTAQRTHSAERGMRRDTARGQAVPLKRTAYVYTACDRRVKTPEGLTEARQDTYNVLVRATAPLTVREVAAKAKHPTETTQQLLVWLVKTKLAKRERRELA